MEDQTVKQLPKRVELHAHLDGCARHQTLWELSKAKDLELPGKGTLEDLIAAVEVRQPRDLEFFLRGFKYIIPPFLDDLDAIKRLCREYCEDAAKQDMAYIEARYCPHLFLSGNNRELTPAHVVEAVCQGLKEGEEKYGVQVRSLLCSFRPRPEWAMEILNLCEQFRDRGVVGIDIAGDEKAGVKNASNKRPGCMFDPMEESAYEEARKLLIGRTVHAGEDGPAEAVKQAVHVLGASRIGHGYHTVDDPAVLADCLKRQTHFELCPISSRQTGSVPMDLPGMKHPARLMIAEGANFSINRDGSTIGLNTHAEDLDVVRSWGFGEDVLARAALNGAKACFLGEEDKNRLIKRLKKAHGMEDD